MMSLKELFHKLSFLQYVLMSFLIYYAVKPSIIGFDSIWEKHNNARIFAGLAVSFGTLQDTTRTQNKLSKRVWESPRKGKIFLIYMGFITLLALMIGIYGMYVTENQNLRDLSVGLLVLGIGLIGMVKSGAERYENHRKDRMKIRITEL